MDAQQYTINQQTMQVDVVWAKLYRAQNKLFYY